MAALRGSGIRGRRTTNEQSRTLNVVRRTERINEQLRQEISLLIRAEVRDPRVGLATITGVETSPELDHARVYITSLGDEDEKEAVLAGLVSAAPFIRGQLGRRLHMRRIPELHFEIDRQLENARRIEDLLREALPDREATGEDGDADG
jgi:ribosome-binding factor A